MSRPDDLYARRLAREFNARQQAEALLEQKSRELFEQAREREQAVAALRESEERYRLIVELSPDAILIEVEGRIIFANSAAHHLFCATENTPLLGRSLISLAAPHDQKKVETDLQRLHSVPRCPETEELAVRLDGTRFEVAVQRVALHYKGTNAVQMIARDISARKRLEYQLAHQASHDSLTGAVNRARVVEILQDALAYAARYQQPVWVGFLDLDRFKLINDRYGHRIGDQLLIEVTRRIQAILRATDVIGRFGGDEFILVLRGGGDDRNHVQRFIERIMAAVNAPLILDGYHLQISCSLGLSAYPADGDDPARLIEHADAAMYRAKQSGRNTCLQFSAEMNQQHMERTSIESALYTVLERDELFLDYQPQIDLRSGRIIGVEALLRWRHPELGLLSPDRFITIAEDSGMIVKIGAWVLRQACLQCAAWISAGLGPLRVAVNLSARQLVSGELHAMIRSALDESGLAPASLELELTETMMMQDTERTQHLLQDLRAMGIRIAVDDFGTGYSSFAYLRRLALDNIKIDKTFVRALDGDEDSQAIVSTLIQLARNLNLSVTAEGVETEFQLAFLRQHGCNEAQGFLFSRPLAPAALETLLLDSAAARCSAA